MITFQAGAILRDLQSYQPQEARATGALRWLGHLAKMPNEEVLICLRVATPNEEVLSPRNPRRHHATGRVLRRCGVGVWVYLYIDFSMYRDISRNRYINTPIGVGTPVHLGLSVSWIACIACYNNIVQLGCRLIA